MAKAFKEQIRHQKCPFLMDKVRANRAAAPLFAVCQHTGQYEKCRHLKEFMNSCASV